MITVRLQGGLGNQLFQFAFGYAIVQRFDTVLCLDVSHYSKNGDHGGFRLDNLKLGSQYINVKDFSSFRARELCIKLTNKFPSVMRLLGYYGERLDEPNDEVELHDNLTYVGYWQSERYFLSFHEHIKNVVVPNVITKQSLSLSEKIKNSDCSLSIHVRRGDYISNKSAFDTHGVCSVGYYQSAINTIMGKDNVTNVFIFSDDIEWCKKNLQQLFHDVLDVQYVSCLTQEEDLWLMSQAKHHIIANSSFSWWGAWLAKHEQQIVIAPTPWYNMPPKYSTDPSLPEWIRLPK